MNTRRALRSCTIWMLGRRIGRGIARGGCRARGLDVIMLDTLLLVCFVVILEEDRMREIWTRAAAACRHLNVRNVLAENLKGVDLQQGKKGRRVDQLG